MKTQVLLSLLAVFVVYLVSCDKVKSDSSDGGNAAKKERRKLPKDPLYITDMDIENLYDEWEDSDEEKLPPDELPPHKRPLEQMDLPAGQKENDLFKDPDKLMRASKKGRTVMAFVTVGNNPSRDTTDMLTQRWQVALINNHMKCERFLVSDDRAIFVFQDGSLAFEAKDYFLDQPELKEFSIDNRVWQGKAYPIDYPNAQKDGSHKSGEKVTSGQAKEPSSDDTRKVHDGL